MNNVRTLITGATVVAAGAGVAAAVAVTGTASAGTAGHSSAGAAASFAVTAHQGSDASLDLGTSGFGAGDEDLFTGALTRSGQHVGRIVGSCTTARAGKTSVDQLCEFMLRMGSSQITALGTVHAGQSGPGTFTLPIAGGTGRYSTAAGQIAVTASSGRSIPITVTLR
jgi:hypothetical protein